MVGISYSNYWVIYNRDSYQFIKQSLINQINKETKIIYVNGKLSPGAGNPYVTFNVNNILKELGKNTNEYKVLQSDNNFLIAHITLENERSLRKKLSDDEYKKFMSYYKYSDYYSYYSFKEDSERVIDKDFMKKCLMVAELIPNEESREVAYINLSGFNEIHKF